MLTVEQLDFIKNKISKKIETVTEDIVYLKEVTKPISPENAIGRISRMDAINNKSVAEESLRKAIDKLGKLKDAQNKLKDDDFGQCQKCKETIDYNRIAFMPEIRRCMKCAR